MTPKQRVIQARSELLLGEPFFWNLAYQLKLVEDGPCGCEHSGGPTCPHTMWTDGQSVGFNPEWVKTLTIHEVMAVICHEVMHVAQGHPWRRSGRDQSRWNDACDRAINPMLLAANKKLPEPFLMPDMPGKSAEEYYGHELKRQKIDGSGRAPKKDKGGQQGRGPQGSSGNQQQPQQNTTPPQQPQRDKRGQGVGEVRDYPGPDKQAAEVKWQQAVLRAAAIAKMQGKLPAFVEQMVQEIKDTKIDWPSALRRFFEQCAAEDYSWKMPNKRYIAAGLYMPSLKSERMGPVVLLWDTSGSMDDQENRAIIAGECKSIIEEVKPEKTYVIYTDTEVHRVDEFEPDDEIKFNPIGGGGTNFKKAFERIKQEGWQPACFIGITDLYATLPEEAPEYPVIWACTTKQKAHFGETLEVRL